MKMTLLAPLITPFFRPQKGSHQNSFFHNWLGGIYLMKSIGQLKAVRNFSDEKPLPLMLAKKSWSVFELSTIKNVWVLCQKIYSLNTWTASHQMHLADQKPIPSCQKTFLAFFSVQTEVQQCQLAAKVKGTKNGKASYFWTVIKES